MSYFYNENTVRLAIKVCVRVRRWLRDDTDLLQLSRQAQRTVADRRKWLRIWLEKKNLDLDSLHATWPTSEK